MTSKLNHFTYNHKGGIEGGPFSSDNSISVICHIYKVVLMIRRCPGLACIIKYTVVAIVVK